MSYEPEGGPAQVGYRVQVDRTTAFDAPVIDVSAASPDAFCSLDLPACGDYCVRVKVQTGPATWTGWSSAVWFRTGLIRILSFPETYDATQLGPDTDARFTVLQTPLREPPGTITFAWPGIIVRSAECPISFAAQLATPGHYFLVAAATLEGYPGLIDGTQVEFVVTW